MDNEQTVSPGEIQSDDQSGARIIVHHQAENLRGKIREAGLLAAALGLCLRRYGAPDSAALNVLTCLDADVGSVSGISIGLSFADELISRDWVDAVSGMLEMSDQHVSRDTSESDGWRTALVVSGGLSENSYAAESSNYDRVFAVEMSDGELRLAAMRPKSADDRWPLEQMLVHWEQLALELLEKPDERIGRLNVLTGSEMESLIDRFDHPEREVENPRFGFELFDDQVERTPDALAVTDGDRTLSYRELWERANRLANYLRSLGVGSEVVVGVFLERSIELVVSVIALQKAGGAYLPIDPGYPVGRLEYLISDSRVPFILTNEVLANKLPEGAYRAVLVDSEADRVAEMGCGIPKHGLKPGNMAYVFYTSGSTGRPKGVMMRHAVRAPIDQEKRKPDDLAIGEKVLLKSAVGFTLILREIFWPLQYGGHLIVVPRELDKDSAYMVRVLRDENVVGANFVPSMLSLIVDEPGIEDCKALRLIYTVGERLAVSLQKRLFERLPGVRLFVFYGCTEAPSATYRECRPDESYGNRIVIGKPMANKKIYLLDRNLMPVPFGAVGEIHTGGAISRGYLHRPAMTADRFIPNPFSSRPGDRFYRTGDLGRWLPDGNLEFIGRVDFQVQIRGIRIELGEIEAVMRRHSGVKEALVVADSREPEQTRLVGYYTEHTGRMVSVSDLRDQIRADMPEYMVPSVFMRLDTFPLNANGKVDRRNLPEPTMGNHPSGPIVDPRNEEEARLAGVWANILQSGEFGVTDRYFDLGGDSMLAVKAVSAINREFGSRLSLPDFYANPTIEAQARLVSGDEVGSHLRQLLPISRSGKRRPIYMANSYPFLVRYFGPNQPYYGMRSHWLDARFDYGLDVAGIARGYVHEMREVQPQGPYAVIGFSMGGIFALEIARQLEEAGETLDCLILLDPTLPRGVSGSQEFSSNRSQSQQEEGRNGGRGVRKRGAFSGLKGLSVSEKVSYIWARRGFVRNVSMHLVSRAKLWLGRGINAVGLQVPFGLRRLVATDYYIRIREAYRPEPLRSRATVYLAEGHDAADMRLLEQLFPGRLDIRYLRTRRHLDVMEEPQLSVWMADLRERLENRGAAGLTLAREGGVEKRSVQCQ